MCASSSPGIINLQDKQGNTPLHFASKAGQVDMISHLKSLGGNPTIRNAKSQAPKLASAQESLEQYPGWAWKSLSNRIESSGLESFADNNNQGQKAQQHIKKVPRNAKCPCGSGLKYKNCCGK